MSAFEFAFFSFTLNGCLEVADWQKLPYALDNPRL
jgi:hypothetical protein